MCLWAAKQHRMEAALKHTLSSLPTMKNLKWSRISVNLIKSDLSETNATRLLSRFDSERGAGEEAEQRDAAAH